MIELDKIIVNNCLIENEYLILSFDLEKIRDFLKY